MDVISYSITIKIPMYIYANWRLQRQTVKQTDRQTNTSAD